MTTNVTDRTMRRPYLKPAILSKNFLFSLTFLLSFSLSAKDVPYNNNNDSKTTILDKNNSNNTCIAVATAVVGIDAAASGIMGRFNATFDIKVQNTGSNALDSLSILEDLSVANQFGTAFINIVEAPEIIQSTATTNPTLNILYDGSALNPDILNTSGRIEAGQFFIIRTTIELHPNAIGAPDILQYQATVSGTDQLLVITSDLSDSGLDVLSSNPNQPGDTGGSDDPTLLPNCWETLNNGLVCNDLLRIGLNIDCQAVLQVNDFLENYFSDCGQKNNFPLGGFYRMEVWLDNGEPVIDLNPNTLDIYEFEGNLLNQNLNIKISEVIYGNSCSSSLLIEDKTAPTCDLALEAETLIDYDWDNDGIIEIDVPDPSGVDDLANEYVLCSVLDQNGFEIYFDELEAHDADNNNNGNFTDIGIDVRGDFKDCTAIDYIYFEDEYFEVCDLTDLQNIPVDETHFNPNEFAIAEIYKRTWNAIDINGYSSLSVCSQYIFGLRPKGHRIIITEEISLDCNDNVELSLPYYTVDNQIDNNGLGSMGQAVLFPNGNDEMPVSASQNPYFLNPEGSTCLYSVSFHEDETIEDCEGSSHLFRHWSVVDWCNGERVYDEFSQLIKIEDLTAPTIGIDLNNDGIADSDTTGQFLLPPTNIDLNASNFDCIATGNIPFLVSADDCSSSTNDIYNVTIERIPFSTIDPNEAPIFIANFENGGNVNTLNLPIGNYNITYFAADDCGNESTHTILSKIVDQQAPVAICNDILNVTLNNFEGDFAARVYGEDLDDSSFDNCQDLSFLVRSLNNNSTEDDNFQAWVDFNCADIGETILVELLAFEDPNDYEQFTDIENNQNGFDSPDNIDDLDGRKASICTTIVQVNESSYPILFCEDKTLNCDDPNLGLLFSNFPTEDIDGDGMIDDNGFLCAPEMTGICSDTNDIILYLDIINIDYDTICRQGSFIRKFTATRIINDMELTSVCEQTITASFVSDWTMNFPADLRFDCQNTGNRLPPALSIDEIMPPSIGCDKWGMEVEDEVFDIIGQDGNGACFKVIRTYKFINWCTWDVTNTEIGIVNRPTNFIEEGNEVQLRHRSINLGINEFGDEDDDDFYNEDPNNEDDGALIHIDNIDLPQSTELDLFDRIYRDSINGGTRLGIYAENYGYFAYRQIIKIVDDVAPVVDEIADIVVLDTVGNCDSDLILLPPEVEECRSTYEVEYEIIDAQQQIYDQGTFPGVGLVNNIIFLENVPVGEYEVNYLVYDGCGNSTTVSYRISIVDAKAPIAYCFLGLVVDLMETGMVEIQARRFDAGSFDNCSEDLIFSFSSDIGDTTKIMDCDSLGAMPQEIWVTDPDGNQSFCENIVVIQPNGEQTLCTDSLGLLAGFVQTADGKEVENVAIYLNGNTNMSMTEVDGSFSFYELENGQDYSLVPEKNNNPLNGVSTFDLVKIKKHILDIESFDSPYKMIAADVNRSENITTFDLVELRKLILNIDTEFNNNRSWRFVASDYVFPQANNPWLESFPEAIHINDLSENEIAMDFIAIKIGDVNESAIPNTLTEIDNRSNRSNYIIEIDDRKLEKGEHYQLDFNSNFIIELDDMNIKQDISDFIIELDDMSIKQKQLAAYQLTLHFDTDFIIFDDINNALAQSENFGLHRIKEGIITLSWDGDASNIDETLFSFNIKAKKNGKLSDHIYISSEVTTAEAYMEFPDNKIITEDVILHFNKINNNQAINHLYQNKPNPFTNKTTILFDIKEAGQVTLSWYNVNGQLVHQIQKNCNAEQQHIEVNAADLQVGLLYYSLTTDTEVLTRKMIVK